MRTNLRYLMIVPMLMVGFQPAVFAGGNSSTEGRKPRSAKAIAAEVDQVILSELEKGGVKPAEQCNDEDFLRRASLDIAGQLPTPAEIKAFRADSSPDKRAAMIDKLIASSEFGKNWARYWRDVIYLRATEQRSRFNQEEFTDWMAEQWNKGTGWNATVTSLLTALGNVEEHPETALIFAQGASAEDVAAESCRIFLGIQLQCANCHDHPSDIWKREQFHQLAAYFPRISERREMKGKPEFEIVSVNTDRRPGEFMHEHPDLFVRSMDRNQDQKLSKEELQAGPKFRGKTAARRKKMGTDNMQEEMQPKMSEGMQANKGKLNPKLIDRLFAAGDTDKDGLLSVDEIKTMPQEDKKRKGSAEHLMADLKHPESPGTVIDPKFFVDGSTLSHGLSDEDRRKAAAKAFTSPDNPWFARAIVNRVWAEMLGEGFYMPVDDLGPNRSARYPEAMELICASFVANNYDPKWLVRTVANTEAYQRKIQTKTGAEGEMPFASATPVTLRSDVIFNSLMGVIGAPESKMGTRPKKKGEQMKESPRAFLQSPRFLFDALFGVDPSVPKDEVTGNIPQSLLMMNSRVFRTGTSAKGEGKLAKIVSENKDNHEAIREVYLLVLAREPSPREIEICMNYLADVKSRGEAFEDLMWSLLNSTEFLSRR